MIRLTSVARRAARVMCTIVLLPALASAASLPPDSLTYSAERIEYSPTTQEIVLTGDAKAAFGQRELEAEIIRYDAGTNVLYAAGVPDTSAPGGLAGTPIFRDGEEVLYGETMTYNLTTRRGQVRRARTTFQDGFYRGDHIEREAEDVLNVARGRYTTCDLETAPHYHFDTDAMKVIKERIAVARSVTMYIRKVPILWLPFFVFSIEPGRHSGLLVPRIGSSSRDGRYAQNLGYYFAPSDRWDLLVRGRLRERAGFLFEGDFRYALRYRMGGAIGGSFERESRAGAARRSRWDFNWRHHQELGQRTTLKANANFVSDRRFFRDNSDDLTVRASQQIRSDLALDHRWQDGASLEVRLSRTERLDQDDVSEMLPSVGFRLPERTLRRGAAAGRIGRASRPEGHGGFLATTYVRYNARLVHQNALRAGRPNERRVALDHVALLRSPQRLGGWLDVSPRVDLRETWFDEDLSNRWLVRRGTFGTSLGLSTTLYGLFRAQLGPVSALRHVVRPSLSVRFRPGFGNLDRFPTVGSVGRESGARQFALTSRLGNTFQIKLGEGKAARKLDLIEMDFSLGYDFEKARRRLSNLGVSAAVKPSRAFDIRLRSSHDFYRDETTEALGFPRLTSVTMTTSLTVGGSVGSGSAPSAFGAGPRGLSEDRSLGGGQTRGSRLALRHHLGIRRRTDGSERRQWLEPEIALSPSTKWWFSYRMHLTLSDPRSDGIEVSNPALSARRDLHCWEARFRWRPSGPREGYYFVINIKALPDVKFEHKRGIGSVGRF